VQVTRQPIDAKMTDQQRPSNCCLPQTVGKGDI